MGTLILNLVGVNAYVPHTDGKSLLAVLPNGSHLGTSPSGALDGTPIARHLPFLWEESIDANGNLSVSVPSLFPGARLSFDLLDSAGASIHTSADLSAIMAIAQKGWLELDPNLLIATPDSRASGQVLVTTGTVDVLKPLGQACNPVWSKAGFYKELEPVVPGLTVRIEGVGSVTATATTWVGAGLQPVYSRDLKVDEEVNLYVGNVCAEDALDWPRNSVANRAGDDDFKWIYGLSSSSELLYWINGGLPVPVVRGSGINYYFSPSEAFNAFWGGGGGAGCECNGCIDQPRAFSF